MVKNFEPSGVSYSVKPAEPDVWDKLGNLAIDVGSSVGGAILGTLIAPGIGTYIGGTAGGVAGHAVGGALAAGGGEVAKQAISDDPFDADRASEAAWYGGSLGGISAAKLAYQGKLLAQIKSQQLQQKGKLLDRLERIKPPEAEPVMTGEKVGDFAALQNWMERWEDYDKGKYGATPETVQRPPAAHQGLGQPERYRPHASASLLPGGDPAKIDHALVDLPWTHYDELLARNYRDDPRGTRNLWPSDPARPGAQEAFERRMAPEEKLAPYAKPGMAQKSAMPAPEAYAPAPAVMGRPVSPAIARIEKYDDEQVPYQNFGQNLMSLLYGTNPYALPGQEVPGGPVVP